MKTVLKVYWPSIKKHGWIGMTALLFMVFTALNKAAYPFLLRDLLESLNGNSTKSPMTIVWLIAGLQTLTNVIWYLYDALIALFETRVMLDLSRRSFGTLQSQSMRFFENTFSGGLVTSAKRFYNSFESIADAFFYQIGRSFVMIILTLIVFTFKYPWLGLAFGVWIVIFSAVSVWIAHLRMKRDILAADKDSAVGGAFADSLSNQTTVKSFAMERNEEERFRVVTEDWHVHLKSAWLFGIALIRIQGVIWAIFEVVFALMLIWGWQNGTIDTGDFIFFQTYTLILMAQVWDIGNMMHRVFRYVADAKEMMSIYQQKPEVQDAAGAYPLNVQEGGIYFQAISFSYIDREREHHDVNDFTLRILPGQMVAFVGHSGAGKSTLVKLLLRFYDPHFGFISIDGQDIACVTQDSLRQQIAIVPQRPDLFHRSLRENIAFAQRNASESDIIAAARQARAWDFIDALPNKLDTLVGERGVKLSGGELQRVALARAFLADAPILVLDEATSALDSRTEKEIRAATADLMKRRTCIVIAHRLSTIEQADLIVVMEKGSIVEQGVHSDLLKKNGVYASLHRHQVGGFIK